MQLSKRVFVAVIVTALLVWGTRIVRTGILRVFGENLRHVLAVGMGSRVQALLAGVGVTLLVVSAVACLGPALRAMRVDPIEALRCQ